MLMICYDTPKAGAWESDLHAAFRALARPYQPDPSQDPIDAVRVEDLKKAVGGDNEQSYKDFTGVFQDAFPAKGDDNYLDLNEFLGFFLPPPS